MIQYDQNIVDKWRPKSIRTAEELPVGKVFWDNGRHHVVVRCLTNLEYYQAMGFTFEAPPSGGPVYFVEACVDNRNTFVNLKDMGVTEHPYNPWMLFSSEQDCLDYMAELAPTIRIDPESELYDDEYLYD